MFWTIAAIVWIAPQILLVIVGMIAANRNKKTEEESAPVRMLASHPALKAIRSVTPAIVRKISSHIARVAPKELTPLLTPKAAEKIDTRYSFVSIDR